MFLVHFHGDSSSKCAACEGEKHQTSLAQRARLAWSRAADLTQFRWSRNLIWWVVEGGYKLWNDFKKAKHSEVSLDCRQDKMKRRSVLRLLERSRLQRVVNFLMIRFLRRGVSRHHPQKIKSSTTWKMLSLTLSQRQDCEHVCFFAAWSRANIGEKEPSLFSEWGNTFTYILSPPTSLWLFFFSSFRANKHIPTSNNSKYLCSVSSIQTFMLAWKTNSNSQHLIWTVFFPAPCIQHTLQSKYLKDVDRDEKKKEIISGKIQSLNDTLYLLTCYLIRPSKRSHSPAGSFHITLDSLPMQLMHRGTRTHAYFSSCSVWPCAVWSTERMQMQSRRPGEDETSGRSHAQWMYSFQPERKTLQKKGFHASLLQKIYCCCYFQSPPTFKARSVWVRRTYTSTQSESEQSLVLEDLCFLFLFLFFLSFFFLSFLFFLFLLRWWSEEEEEEEELELSELEEVVSWSSCCSCWILESGKDKRRRWGLESSAEEQERTTDAHSDAPGVGRRLKCPWGRNYRCPSGGSSGPWSLPSAHLCYILQVLANRGPSAC